MKQISIIGHLGKDATTSQQKDYFLINFNVAVSNKFTNKEGVEITETDWFLCTFRRKKSSVANFENGALSGKSSSLFIRLNTKINVDLK